MAQFPKPKFSALLANFDKDASSVHECSIIDTEKNNDIQNGTTINTCAARVSEALVIANGFVRDRFDIAYPTRRAQQVTAVLSNMHLKQMNLKHSDDPREDEFIREFHAKTYKIQNDMLNTLIDIEKRNLSGDPQKTTLLLAHYGYPWTICRHGIARGAQDLGRFLKNHWGVRTKGWETQKKAPPELSGKTGIILFIKVPTFLGQGHIDLWNKTRVVGGEGYWGSKEIYFWELA